MRIQYLRKKVYATIMEGNHSGNEAEILVNDYSSAVYETNRRIKDDAMISNGMDPEEHREERLRMPFEALLNRK